MRHLQFRSVEPSQIGRKVDNGDIDRKAENYKDNSYFSRNSRVQLEIVPGHPHIHSPTLHILQDIHGFGCNYNAPIGAAPFARPRPQARPGLGNSDKEIHDDKAQHDHRTDDARDHACCCACPGSACRGNTSRSGLGQVNELRGCGQNACGPGLCFTGHSTLRSKRKTISFNKPFSLKGLDGVQPAGDYEIVTDEKRIETTLFEAWQRVGTQIRLPSLAVDTGIEQYTTIEPGDLEDALRSDHPTDEVRRLERFHD